MIEDYVTAESWHSLPERATGEDEEVHAWRTSIDIPDMQKEIMGCDCQVYAVAHNWKKC